MIAKEFTLGNDFPKIDYATWRKAVEAELKGGPFDKKMVSHTYEGIDLQPIYTEEIFPTSGDPFGVPGFPPFVRGSRVLGNSLTGWDIRQEHAAADPAEVNAQILDDLRNNVRSIVVRLDAASRAGYDVDDPIAGLLDRPRRRHDLGCGRPGASPRSSASRYHRGLARRRRRVRSGRRALCSHGPFAGVEPDRFKGAFSADPLGALMREGSLPVPIDVALKQMADLAAWTAAHAPHMTAVEVGTVALPPCRRDLGAGPGVPARHRRRVLAGAHRGWIGRRCRGKTDHLQRQCRLPVLPGHREDPSGSDAVGAGRCDVRRRSSGPDHAAANDDKPACADLAQPNDQHPAQHCGLLRRRHRRCRRHYHGSLRRPGRAQHGGEPPHRAEYPAHPRRGMSFESRRRSRGRILVHRVVYPAARRERPGRCSSKSRRKAACWPRRAAAGSPSKSTRTS